MNALYSFYSFGESTQCPLSVVLWPGWKPTAEIGDIIVDLLKQGADVELKHPPRPK